jgi:hypothetical protein
MAFGRPGWRTNSCVVQETLECEFDNLKYRTYEPVKENRQRIPIYFILFLYDIMPYRMVLLLVARQRKDLYA